MRPGESARGVAQRWGRAWRLRRPLLRPTDARDSAGGEVTGTVLSELPYGWTVLQVAPPDRRGALLDQVVIGPGGVYAVAGLNWAGTLTVTDGALCQDGRSREDVVADVTEAARAVAGSIGQVPVVPVLCFVRNEPLAGWSRDAMVCSTSNVVAMLTARPTTLQPATISRLLPELVRTLAPAVGSAAPTPRPARRERTSRRRSRAPRAPVRARRTPRVPAGRIAVLALAVCAVVAVAPSGKALVTNLAKQGAQRVLGPTKPVGATQTVAADSSHPELAITVRSVVDTQVIGRHVAPPSGTRLVAVPITIADRSDRSWTWGATTRIVLLDDGGGWHVPTPLYQHVSVGTVLPAGPTVAAHQRIEGAVVFAVPAGTHVSGVRIVVGPGLPVTLRWTLTH